MIDDWVHQQIRIVSHSAENGQCAKYNCKGGDDHNLNKVFVNMSCCVSGHCMCTS